MHRSGALKLQVCQADVLVHDTLPAAAATSTGLSGNCSHDLNRMRAEIENAENGIDSCLPHAGELLTLSRQPNMKKDGMGGLDRFSPLPASYRLRFVCQHPTLQTIAILAPRCLAERKSLAHMPTGFCESNDMTVSFLSVLLQVPHLLFCQGTSVGYTLRDAAPRHRLEVCLPGVPCDATGSSHVDPCSSDDGVTGAHSTMLKITVYTFVCTAVLILKAASRLHQCILHSARTGARFGFRQVALHRA